MSKYFIIPAANITIPIRKYIEPPKFNVVILRPIIRLGMLGRKYCRDG